MNHAHLGTKEHAAASCGTPSQNVEAAGIEPASQLDVSRSGLDVAQGADQGADAKTSASGIPAEVPAVPVAEEMGS